MSAYLQAAGPPRPAHWGPAAGSLQPFPASMLDVLVLQAQLLQLQAPYTGFEPAALPVGHRQATAMPMSAAPEPQAPHAAGTGVFIPQYAGQWTRRRRSPRRDRKLGGGKAGLGGDPPSHPGSPTSTLQPVEARAAHGCPIAALPGDDDFTEAYSRH